MESDYFLTEYMNTKRKSLKCVIKHLYSDFIVNEVTKDGTVVEIAHTAEPNQRYEEPPKIVPKPDEITEKDIVMLNAVLSGEQKSGEICTGGFDKEQRKKIHEWIRSKYDNVLDTQTSNSCIIVKMENINTRKRKSWPAERPNFLHFTLSKENKDTNFALSVIAQCLGCKNSSFSICGMKDRRAVTSQRVSVYRFEARRLNFLNDRLHGIRISELNYQSNSCKLGDLWGNRFKLILREIDVESKEDIVNRIREFEDNGFINYFGTQRFGSCGVDTAAVGLAILRKRWKDAVNIILKSRNLSGPLREVLNVWNKTHNAALSLEYAPSGQIKTSIEGQLLLALAKNCTNYYDAVMSLSRNCRSLYLHAYQSLIWNRVTSRRMKTWGTLVVPGDIDIGGKPIFNNGKIQQVALPLIASSMIMPNNEASNFYKQILSEDEVSPEMFQKFEKHYAIGSVLRPLIVIPKDVKYQFINYPNEGTRLQPDLNGNMDSDLIGSGNRLAIAIEFSLPSSAYATVALREIMRSDMGKMGQIAQSSISDFDLI